MDRIFGRIDQPLARAGAFRGTDLEPECGRRDARDAERSHSDRRPDLGAERGRMDQDRRTEDRPAACYRSRVPAVLPPPRVAQHGDAAGDGHKPCECQTARCTHSPSW